MSKFILLFALIATIAACHSNTKSEENAPVVAKDSSSRPEPVTKSVAQSTLPSFVAFKNWEIGDPELANSVLGVYEAWDRENTDSMAKYFADSAIYDFPNGTRIITTRRTIAATFRKWRHEYMGTSNIPFSLISLHNNDNDQDWVIAWTWNKWQYKDGKRDSALYCDNWRIKGGKIIYLNSLENNVSKALAKRLNENIPK